MSNVVYWSPSKSWADVWAEVVAAGGYAIILVEGIAPGGITRTVTYGSYDFGRVIFRALPRYGINSGNIFITFAPGVLLDAGDVVALNVDGPIRFSASAPLMTPGPKQIALNFSGGAQLRSTADVTLFNSSFTGGQHVIRNLNSGGVQTATGATNPAIFLNHATANMVIESRGVGFNNASFSFGGFYPPSIGGLAGSSVTVYADPQAFVTPSDVAAPVAFLQQTAYSLRVPFAQGNALPAPSVAYDGALYRLAGSPGVPGKLYCCLADAAGAYGWVLVCSG